MRRIGVDTGGTFTDGILWDDEKGVIANAKTSSVSRDPSEAVMSVVGKLGGLSGVDHLLHGTTVATNAALEQSGGRVGLICTAGFRDVLEIGRLSRAPAELYDLLAPSPPCLVRRRDRLEVRERVDHRGQIVEDLNEQDVLAVAETIRGREIRSLAVCLLHSYANPAHEQRVKEILQRELPDVSISISTDILPEFREYERSTTTVLNAYLAPIVEGYLRQLQDRVAAGRSPAQLWVMQSNGGVVSAEAAARTPVSLLLSGPSGGVVAGRYLLEQTGLANGITLDMGGTSFDVGLLPDRTIPMTNERDVMGMPVKMPSADILTIGAGGGSIGWVDDAGQFKVGPRSAGARPGPACYGRGGDEPTVTDANLVLGILGDGQKLGGEVDLDERAAFKACEKLAARLNMSTYEVAWGIRRIVNVAMAGATRAVSVGRGYDPRDFALLAFGGAGPMHAADIACELDSPRIILPPVPGCYCALGLVVSDVTRDYVATHLAPFTRELAPTLEQRFATLLNTADSALHAERIEPKRREFFRSIDMRYVGEQSSVTVPVTQAGSSWLASALNSFHDLHEKLYGFKVIDEPVEVVNVRLRAVGRLSSQSMLVTKNAVSATRAVAVSERKLSLGPDKNDRCVVPVYDRLGIMPGAEFTGPAIVEQADTTLIVPPKFSVTADSFNNLHMERR